MIERDIWLEEFLQSFLESLTDEELENLIEEIQEELRRRRGGERYIHRTSVFPLLLKSNTPPMDIPPINEPRDR